MEKDDASADTLMIDLAGGKSILGGVLVELACKKIHPDRSGEIYEMSPEAQKAITKVYRNEALMKRTELYAKLYSNAVPLGGADATQ